MFDLLFLFNLQRKLIKFHNHIFFLLLNLKISTFCDSNKLISMSLTKLILKYALIFFCQADSFVFQGLSRFSAKVGVTQNGILFKIFFV